jgi:hypothetical protein
LNAQLNSIIGLGIVQQLIVGPLDSRLSGPSDLVVLQNIIPTFTLVYIGLKNTTGGIGQVPSNSGIPTLASGY